MLEVDDTGCPGLAAAIPFESDGTMTFVHHADATQYLRDQMSSFFIDNSLLTDAVEFEGLMKSLGDAQLMATLGRLAGGLPMYRVGMYPPPPCPPLPSISWSRVGLLPVVCHCPAWLCHCAAGCPACCMF